MRTKVLAATLALTTALTVAACGGDDTKGTGDTITLMARLFGTAPNPNGELQKAIEALIGKKLSVTWVPDASYNDKANWTNTRTSSRSTRRPPRTR